MQGNMKYYVASSVVVLFAVFAISSAAVHISGASGQKSMQFSDSAKLKIRRGLVGFINHMCSPAAADDVIESSIVTRICLPAAKLAISTWSRCSTCDAYVDPMCMLDCPQIATMDA